MFALRVNQVAVISVDWGGCTTSLPARPCQMAARQPGAVNDDNDGDVNRVNTHGSDK